MHECNTTVYNKALFPCGAEHTCSCFLFIPSCDSRGTQEWI